MNLKNRLLVLAALLLSTASFAFADPTSPDAGSLTVTGHDTFSTSALTFITPFAASGNGSVFSNFSNGSVNYLLGTVDPFANAYNLNDFTITNSTGAVLSFWDDSNDAKAFTDPTTGYLDLSLYESGFYTINGGPALPGFVYVTFYGTSYTGAAFGEAFVATGGLFDPPRTPEPSSLLLLGTALCALGTAGYYVRRRRTSLHA